MDSINNIVNYLIEKMNSNPLTAVTLCLNEDNISLKEEYSEEIYFNNNEKLSLKDLILQTYKGLTEKQKYKEVWTIYSVQNFGGYENCIKKGINFMYERDDDVSMKLTYTSSIEKEKRWIIDFLQYIEYRDRKEPNENTEGIKELNEFLDNDMDRIAEEYESMSR